jgi:bacillithiol biosynthesis cysteine-adding enzyme BshC
MLQKLFRGKPGEPVETHCYPITILPHLSRLFTEYAASERALEPFFAVSPRDEKWVAHRVQFEGNRAVLAALLEAQNQAWGAGAATLENIQRIREGADVVVTGQQVVLFGGPLFTLYKAATAIARAKAAGAVPVFWLATEDHDLEEANHGTLATRHALKTLRVDPEHAAGQPVGGIKLGRSVEAALAQAAEILGDVPEMDWLREAYHPEATFAEGFARLLLKIFARQGLVVIDAAGREFHAAGAKVLRAALERAEDLEGLLLERDRLLAERGYHSQVLVAKKSSLLFLIDKETGARQPLKRETDGKWTAGKTPYSTAELLAILASEPERLSPNALLRPVFQDTILPTAAYIGGPAEIAYFAQTQVLYQALLGRVTPVLPRLSATVVEAAVRNVMTKFEIGLEDVLRLRPDEMTQRLGARTMPVEGKQQLAAAGQAVDRELTALLEWMHGMDDGLGRSADTASRKIRYQMNRLRRMAANFQLQKDESVRRHVDALYLGLYPKLHLQERTVGVMSYLGKYGDALVDAALNLAEELCPGHREISL